MIGTELLKGQGLGNQLFCYVTTRCIALDQGYEYAILGGEAVANNIHSSCGMYFMNLDYGKKAQKEEFDRIYNEKEDRLFLGNSKHDLTHGCYVTGIDEQLRNVSDGTLMYGNMQAEAYYIKYKKEIRQWLTVKEEYDTYEYSRENLCILHLRCSDYLDCPELYLRKKYWIDGMKNMRKINPNMEFMIITNDTKEASKLLPGIPVYNFDLATDYAILKNAKYLLLANSSFAYFPAFTSTTIQYILAPKYWARHNVSDGYWASEQNIYQGWHYQDRKGKVFSAESCKQELEAYQKGSARYRELNKRPQGMALYVKQAEGRIRYMKHYIHKVMRRVNRRIKIKLYSEK